MSKNDQKRKVIVAGDEEAATEAASSASQTYPIELIEEAPVKKVGKRWEVVVIREGLSKNGVYYPREVLQESIPLWEGKEVAFYGWDPRNRGHAPTHVIKAFPDGTFANHAGHLEGVKGRLVEGHYELVAEFICTQPTVRGQLVEMWEAGRVPGFSIHAFGDHNPAIVEGKKVELVASITSAAQLTLVTVPAANGRATRLIAGQEPNKESEKTEMNLKRVREFVAGKMPDAMRPLVEKMEEKPLLEAASSILSEMSGKFAAKALDALKNGDHEKAMTILELSVDMEEPEAEEPMAAMDEEPEYTEGRAQKNVRRGEGTMQEAARLTEATLKKFESRQILKECLKEAKLPKMAEDRIRTKFDDKVFTESQVQEEISAWNEVLSHNQGGEALIEGQTEKVVRNPHIQVLAESADKFQAAMDLIVLGPKYNPDTDKELSESERQLYKDLQGLPQTKSTKRLYQEASGDWECNQVGRRLGRSALTEAVSTTTFSTALGNAYNLKLQKDFNSMPSPDWDDFVEEVSEDVLVQRDRVIIGGIGLLPTVAEGGTYQDLGQPAEFDSNYTLTKRGGFIEVTEEAILADRIELIRSWPDKLRAAALESEKTVIYKAVTGDLGGSGLNTDTSYDDVVMYHANHGNYSTTPVSNAALVAARAMMKKFMAFSTATALNDATDINDTDTSVVVDSAVGIRAGMYIRCEAEWMLVTDVSSNTLTVTRGMRGSTPASHVDDTPIYSYSGMLPWELNGGFAMNVICSTDKEAAVEVALASQFLPGGANNDVNILYSDYRAGRIKIVTADSIYLGGNPNRWYTAAPSSVSNAIEVGYLGGQRAPQLINQTQDAVGQVFLADTNRFKIKHRVGANKMFHEGTTGHLATT